MMTNAEKAELVRQLDKLNDEQLQRVRVKIAELLASQQNPKAPTQ